MSIVIEVNNSNDSSGRYLSWAPTPCRVRVTDPAGATGPTVNVTLSGRSTATGGAVVFRKGTTGAFSTTLSFPVPVSGLSETFFVAGEFSRPSRQDGDVTIEGQVNGSNSGPIRIRVMVRVRKNANELRAGERDRFINAMATLNDRGLGRFTDFREMHFGGGLGQAHGAAGFLAWHRNYLLDLERELQAIDPSVALPYWKFDEPAPNIFTENFLGAPDGSGFVRFASGHPMNFWRTGTVTGIERRLRFSRTVAPPGLLNQDETLGLGLNYQMFRDMEFNPHNRAHTSFRGFVSNAATAPRDPLFFLLHCNVDRLWAMWQHEDSRRFDASHSASYDNRPLPSRQIGHNLTDTMWPWNGVTGNPRPPVAPGGDLASSPIVTAPGPSPRVDQTLDYQGRVSAINRLGFDYEDVPFA
ncbi:tyrosinase family protein [Gimesia aquarii]|uniref:O-aminophenol oxidase n=1 Tax=Gimesia aquarii TaxID=2527964 RepID=A0A517VWB0_9PLAN|nr:tyrosinase family protein [Gimesia aquarii]QDT97288.1 O-aminophenol oxidase [Gimesia aquarii]